MAKQVSERTRRRRLAKLRELVGESEGSVSEGVRRLTGSTTADLARSMYIKRQQIEQCLTRYGGRRYEGVRRALEVELQLPANGLDEVLDGEG